ncbi:GntR family transcriptional regulator [Microbispora sp. H10836]|uniref:GntR family transcriptional regulator n=1 Tax=Microbispora sp. H10836 TaxID=2729106 RepID=UPI00289352CB|nr:GntR family transcriptional regulator [Microbispora sp. H10836]
MGVIETAIDTIKQMIIDGRLRPGQKLPVEKDLAEQLGVARNTLREAVRARVWRGMSDPQAIHRTLPEHRAVYRALLARDPDRARLHAALHVLGVEESLTSPHTYENPDDRPRTSPGPDEGGRGPRGHGGQVSRRAAAALVRRGSRSP